MFWTHQHQFPILFNVGAPVLSKFFKSLDFPNLKICSNNRFRNDLAFSCISKYYYITKGSKVQSVPNMSKYNIGIHPQAVISHCKPITNHKNPIINSTNAKQGQNSLNLFALFLRCCRLPSF